MPRQSKNSRKNKNKKSRTSQSVMHNDFKQLLEMQKQQEIRFVPEVPDVPRMRINRNTTYNIESSYQTTQTLSTTAPNFGALAFSLASISQSSSYTTVFDQYRILQVNVKILPTGVISGGGNLIYTVLDYDDATVPSSISTYLAYSTLKIAPAGQIDERTLVPRIAVAAYTGSAFSGYANLPAGTFIDSASPNVQYYGLKWYSPQSGANTSITFVVTMVIQFRAQRST